MTSRSEHERSHGEQEPAANRKVESAVVGGAAGVFAATALIVAAGARLATAQGVFAVTPEHGKDIDV